MNGITSVSFFEHRIIFLMVNSFFDCKVGHYSVKPIEKYLSVITKGNNLEVNN